MTVFDDAAAALNQLDGRISALEIIVPQLANRLGKLENNMISLQAVVAGLPNNPSSTPPPPPPSGRTLRRPHIATRAIQRWANTATENAFADAHFDHIDGGTLASHPNAISVQIYSLLRAMEIDTGTRWNPAVNAWRYFYANTQTFDPTLPSLDDGRAAVMCRDFAQSYATSHGQNVEDYWLHAATGKVHTQINIASIAVDGTVTLSGLGHGGAYSFPFSVGQTISVIGTAAGAGTYTIAAVTQTGMKLNAWTAGALGAAGSIALIGTGAATLANRLRIFAWSEWREIPNFGNANCRAMHVARFVNMMGAGTYNCTLIDEMDNANITQTLADRSVEYTIGGVAQFRTDMCSVLTAAKAATGGPKYLRPNTAGYETPESTQIATAAGGIHGEVLLQLHVYDSKQHIDWVLSLTNAGIDVEYSNGDSYQVGAIPAVMTGIPGAVTVGNYPTKTAREQMSLYSTYLMAVDATFSDPDGSLHKHCIIDLTNGFAVGQGPLSSLIPPALDVDIGQPFGAYVRTGGLTDANGQPAAYLRRLFSKDGGTTLSACAFLHTVSSGQNNWGDTSLITITLPTPPAGKAWHLLNQDASLSTATFTTVGLRQAEGAVFVPA